MEDRSTYHKVETRHQQHHVREQEPMSLQCNFAFCEECTGEATGGVSDSITFTVDLRLRETKAEDDDQDRRTGAKPEQWSPAVLGSIDQGPREDGGQKVSKSVTLLQHA